MPEGEVFVDAENAILGRLASYVAKEALKGRSVVVVNAEKAVISGSKEGVLADVKMRLETHTLGAAEKAPVHYRRPDNYVRRVIRGMLPWRKPRGREAFRRIKVYVGKPAEYEGENFIRAPHFDASRLKPSYSRNTVGSVVKEIGGVKG
ncbi:MAG: 50S ribosomal protein L13 [Candidatus Bathyarchaeia archaeon]